VTSPGFTEFNTDVAINIKTLKKLKSSNN
jgi:hypothetical protein